MAVKVGQQCVKKPKYGQKRWILQIFPKKHEYQWVTETPKCHANVSRGPFNTFCKQLETPISTKTLFLEKNSTFLSNSACPNTFGPKFIILITLLLLKLFWGNSILYQFGKNKVFLFSRWRLGGKRDFVRFDLQTSS